MLALLLGTSWWSWTLPRLLVFLAVSCDEPSKNAVHFLVVIFCLQAFDLYKRTCLSDLREELSTWASGHIQAVMVEMGSGGYLIFVDSVPIRTDVVVSEWTAYGLVVSLSQRRISGSIWAGDLDMVMPPFS